MIDSLNCVSTSEKMWDRFSYGYNSSPVTNSYLTNGTSSSESNFNLNHKTFRESSKTNNDSSCNDVPWTFEEEYIFFEAHKILKNKWTKYPSFFPQICKEMKEFKNHFHACIIKTVRRIVNNKYDNKLKDIMRSFYSCEYLNQLLNKMRCLTKLQIEVLNKKKYKYNPKLLIKNKLLTREIINKYKENLLRNYLLQKPIIISLLSMLGIKPEEVNCENVISLFTIIIKTKIIIECKDFIEDTENGKRECSFEKKRKTESYIHENSNPNINYLKIKEFFCI